MGSEPRVTVRIAIGDWEIETTGPAGWVERQIHTFVEARKHEARAADEIDAAKEKKHE